MAKKVRPTFDVAALKELSGKLVAHQLKLAQFIRELPALPTFDQSVKARDASQRLVTTCLTIQHINDSLLFLAEKTGPQIVAHLDDCHLDSCNLDWNSEEDV